MNGNADNGADTRVPEEAELLRTRRLQEELGFTTSLKKIYEFTYRAEVKNDLIEHEYDHVFAGEYDGDIHINPHEVADYCYENMNDIKWAIQEQPHKFTTWFKIAFPTIETWWEQNYSGKATSL